MPTNPPSETDRPEPSALPRERDGASLLERFALARLRQDAAALPASEIVQLVLWPASVADWARDAGVSTAVAYNMLSRFKPYRRVRELLALRLDVPTFVLDHLIDAARPLPAALRALPDDPAAGQTAPPPPPEPVSPTQRLPAVRDGSNPLERRAVWHVWRQIAALPASLVVQLILFPETLAEWARRRQVPASMLYAMLAGTQAHPGLREPLARRLGVPGRALDVLLDAQRREPVLAQPALADRPPDEPTVAASAPSPAEPAPEPPPARDQLSLGL
jgi:hypothetical protein